MNIRQVRNKIRSVSNVRKITKAMQMVSAIKMKKAQTAAIEGQPYRSDLERIIKRVVANLDPAFSPLLSRNPAAKGRDLVIFISSNKGLCGSFNFNLFRYVIKNINFEKTDFITVGKKGASLVGKMESRIIADFSTNNAIDSVSAIFQTALIAFLDGKYQQVKLIYNRFINTLRHEPTETVLLPVNLTPTEEEKKEHEMNNEYIIEPAPETIIDSLLRSLVEEKIRGAIIDSEASEHSARMIAMKNATDNAGDVIYNLTLLRNKIRQEKITYELLDMITAKESVES